MNNATNINNAIATATAAPKPTQQKTPSQMMNAVLSSEATQKMLGGMLGEKRGAFVASVLDLYGTDTYLQKCPAGEVFKECLKAVSLDLPISKQLGFSYVIPYKGHPQFQIGYKGMIQLAMRTGAYKHINAGTVCEGEFVKADKLTGEVDISGEKLSEEVVGYFAYIETINGFSKAEYWTRERVLTHAAKYSKSYQQGAAIWRENFDEMATKTVLRNLLSHWGVMSVQMIVQGDDRAENADKAITGAPVDVTPPTDADAPAEARFEEVPENEPQP